MTIPCIAECVAEDPIIGLLIRLVTLARRALESAPVEHCDLAALVMNEVAPLQRARRLGHANPADAKHLGQKLLRDMKRRSVSAILKHQQPARQSRLDHVEARAGGRLLELAQMDEDITVDFAPQRPALFELTAEELAVQSQRGPGAPHRCAHRRSVHPERKRNPEHAFAADERDFERGGIVHPHAERDEAADGEVDVGEALHRNMENLAEGKLDLFTTVEQLAQIAFWQRASNRFATIVRWIDGTHSLHGRRRNRHVGTRDSGRQRRSTLTG